MVSDNLLTGLMKNGNGTKTRGALLALGITLSAMGAAMIPTNFVNGVVLVVLSIACLASREWIKDN